ncbi:MAG: pantetheine-phosphate adenylyltransferase [Solobacterium sp.]|nr:pantetheine-phosphate adenylyltransferase [Solobacterium sp.]MBR2793985.1 pantetheine-phosphate adenylyltransferase [Solobacterium sp.]
MKVCYPGTFDPITKGHLDIIQRAAALYDEVVILIMRNPGKRCLFSETERKIMIELAVSSLAGRDRISVQIGSGLTVEYAKSIHACAIVRGIRAVSDYEYELLTATANMYINDTIETLLLIARPEYSFLSSSVVKEIGSNGGDIAGMVPKEIADLVKKKLLEKK